MMKAIAGFNGEQLDRVNTMAGHKLPSKFGTSPGRPEGYDPESGKLQSQIDGKASNALKDIPVEGSGQVDKLKQKLAELHEKALAAMEALSLVGKSPEAQQNAEIAKKYAEFLIAAESAKRKLTVAEMADAHSNIELAVKATAAEKYKTELLALNDSLQTTTREHVMLAAAVGHSAQAMQDAMIQAKTTEVFQKKFGANWAQDPGHLADSKAYANNLNTDMNTANKVEDSKTIDNLQRQVDAQNALNAAIDKGAQAKRNAQMVNEEAQVRADFANRPDTDTEALEIQLDLIRQKYALEKQSSDLERAASMDVAQRFKDQKQALNDMVAAAAKAGIALDYHQVLMANKDAWMEFVDAQNKAKLATGGMADGLRVAFDQIANDTESMAQTIKSAIDGAVSSLNDSIAKLMTTGSLKKANFSGAFHNIGDSLAKTGLQKGESAIMKGLGLGNKADGSAASPFWVKIAGVLGGAGQKIDGLMDTQTPDLGGVQIPLQGFAAKLMQKIPFLQGMFADGTDSLIPDMPAIVGEKGPELFVPPSAGSIIPNNKLGGLGQGHTLNVDARGSSDPAQTVALIHQYFAKAAPGLVSAAVNATAEKSARLPPTARR
jgi:hypothetical protein